MKVLFYISILLISVIGSTFVNAQNFSASRGIPFIRNYSSEEYNAHEQNFDIIQSNSGIMYFANFAGVLEFDGTTWNRIPTSSGMRALSLSINKNGTIFVGGLYDFGYLKQNRQKTTSFVSLADSIENKVEIGEIFKVVCAQDANYFVSEKKLFISQKGKLSTINFQNDALSAFYVNNELYVFFDATRKKQNKQFGLCKFENGEFKTIASEQAEKLLDVESMFQIRKSGDIAVASSKQGIFLLQNNEITKLNIAANNYIKQHSLSCIVGANKNTYGIGTINGGFVITDSTGNILQILDKNAGLQDESINAAFIDKKNSVWLATNNGISKAEINWPSSFYDNKNTGLEGKVLDIEKLGNTMFFATDKGLFYLKNNNFYPVKGIKSACWAILNNGNSLWVATTNGIYSINNTVAKLSNIKEFTFCLTKSELNNNRLFAGHSGKFSIMNINSGKLEIINKIDGLDGDIQNIVEQENGDILLEIPPGKIYLYSIKKNTISEIKSENEFISLHINKKNNTTFFSSEKGLFTFDKNTLKLIPYNLFTNDTNSYSFWMHDFFALTDSSFLITDGEQKNLTLFFKSKNKLKYTQTPYLPIADFSVQTLFNVANENTFWIGGKDGLLKSNYNDFFNFKTVHKTLIRKITSLSTDSLIEFTENDEEIKELTYNKNSLRFDFSLPAFPAKGRILYRFFLKGFDNDTSTWTTLTYKDYTNLPDGKYVFSVQAKNEFGETATESVFKFEILTPNYRTWWAITIYIILFLALGYFILQWQMKAAEKEKQVLEDLVVERTLEIEQGRKEVEKQRDIAYKQKQEILDSISYAQKIQEAVLPSKEVADEILNEHFIMYRPRDIVSGDFYWIKKVNNYITAVAADCTGHGVPGAFMSMLGSSFLNEIVTRRSLDNAGQILNRLRSKVKKSLHQEGKSGEQKDGMDVALLIIDTETLELQYAGAYNPLYIIRRNTEQNKNGDENLADYELIQIKADRQPIGIHLLEKEFTNHSFQLEKGDCIYSFSDGYVDQFGGETGGKFKTARFKELLLSVQGKQMVEQKRILEQNFIKWKRDVAQIDDVLVMGIRI